MALKQYVRFVIPAPNKYLAASCTLMGLSFFFRMVYFFGVSSLDSFGVGQLLLDMILPLLLCGGMIVLLGVLRLSNPGLISILGAGFLLLLAISGLFSGSAVRAILGILGYLSAGGLMILTVGGYFPIRPIFNTLIAACAALRVLLFDLGRISLTQWLYEFAVIFMLAALALFVSGLKARPPQNHK